ncbi:MAG: class I SAM-dependent methyltransferase [Treponema sp.]|nr:class I SAM-dependent methyltransferase [Treponema sp.]
MFDENRWAETPGVVDAIESLAASAPGDAVLDACCGPGRHSLEFAHRGYRVTGVDLMESYLEAARESSREDGLDIEFLRADMRDFRRPGSFDLAVNLFNSFGYFADPAEDLGMLRNIRESLRPGGRFVLEMLGKETAARDFTEGEWFERNGWTVLTEYSVVGAWEGMRNRWVLIRGAERIERSFVQRLYSGTEMAALLARAGFGEVRILGSLRGAPYDRKAENLVVLASAAGE